MKLRAPWEETFNKIVTPLEAFIHAQTTTGLVLIFTTIVALIIANSPFSAEYQEFISLHIDIAIGDAKISHSIKHWVNDGLMAIFFFLIGLEIKREILVGELSILKVALLPIMCAVGGMLFPAIIYIAINGSSEGAIGWGIPMATDIAFAISALVILGKRVSPALVTFLVALAIVDDLGAVLVIALFYTAEIHLTSLLLALAAFTVLLIFNRFGVRTTLAYFIVALVMWFFMLESGIHATIAGVITALSIPSYPKLAPVNFTARTKNLLDEYDNYPATTDHMMHQEQKAILQNIKDRIDSVDSPAARLEHDLQIPMSLIIIPLFALVNAGISIDFSSILGTITQPISLGIMFGLFFGKIIGIFGVAFVAVKLGFAKLPNNSTFSQVFGVAALGGIGFTMSIFVADLAFLGDEVHMFEAKTAIIIASIISGFFGYFWLRFVATKKD